MVAARVPSARYTVIVCWYIMFWANTRPVPVATTDLELMAPVIVRSSTSRRSDDTLPLGVGIGERQDCSQPLPRKPPVQDEVDRRWPRCTRRRVGRLALLLPATGWSCPRSPSCRVWGLPTPRHPAARLVVEGELAALPAQPDLPRGWCRQACPAARPLPA